MAGKSLGTLTLDLIAKTGMFIAGLDKAGRKLSTFEKQASKDAANVGKAVGAAISSYATAAATAVGIAINQMDELYNAS